MRPEELLELVELAESPDGDHEPTCAVRKNYLVCDCPEGTWRLQRFEASAALDKIGIPALARLCVQQHEALIELQHIESSGYIEQSVRMATVDKVNATFVAFEKLGEKQA